MIYLAYSKTIGAIQTETIFLYTFKQQNGYFSPRNRSLHPVTVVPKQVDMAKPWSRLLEAQLFPCLYLHWLL